MVHITLSRLKLKNDMQSFVAILFIQHRFLGVYLELKKIVRLHMLELQKIGYAAIGFIVQQNYNYHATYS